MSRRTVVAALATLLLLGVAISFPAAGGAAELGTDGHGVTIVSGHAGLTVVFGPSAAKRYSQLAGHRMEVLCSDLRFATDSPILVQDSYGSDEVAVPARRRPIRTTLRHGHRDVCTIGRALSDGGQRVLTAVPLTDRGYDYLGQKKVEQDILPFTLFPIAALFKDSSRVFKGSGAVRLPSEDVDPPGRRLGLYLTAGHLYVAERDRSGLVLFFARDGSVVRTNLLPFLAGVPGA